MHWQCAEERSKTGQIQEDILKKKKNTKTQPTNPKNFNPTQIHGYKNPVYVPQEHMPQIL